MNNSTLQRAATLAKICQRDSLPINTIAYMLSEHESDQRLIEWRLFLACYKGLLPHSLHPAFTPLSDEFFYDIEMIEEPNTIFSTSYRNFLDFNLGNFYLIGRSEFHSWIRKTEFWTALKENDFITRWLATEIADYEQRFQEFSSFLEANFGMENNLANGEASAMVGPIGSSSNRILKHGDFWEFTFMGQTKTVKNTKGIQYIEYLIRNKGREMHVLELVKAMPPTTTELAHPDLSDMTEGQLAAENLSLGNFDSGVELLDDQTKAALRKCLQDLDDRIEEAEQFGEDSKVERLQTEKERIVAHLSASLGLDGKSRVSSSAVEKARKSVEKRIRCDIKKLKKNFPELADHFSLIKTGTCCLYNPIPDVVWE